MMKETANLIAKIHQDLTDDYPFLGAWTITFDSAKRRAGLCRLSTKEISFSIHHIENNDVNIIRDTILHEFAHAIAFEIYSEKGHGYQWKKIARIIGAIPRARGHFNLPEAPWVLVHICRRTEAIQPVSNRFRRNKKIKNYYLSGRPDTKGELFFVKQSEFLEYKHGQISKDKLVLIQ